MMWTRIYRLGDVLARGQIARTIRVFPSKVDEQSRNALVRRAHGRAAPGISAQAFSLDEDRQCVLHADGARVELTGTEFRLLRYFMLNQGKLLSKTLLTEHVYDQDFDLDSNVIEVYVRRLREKLGKEVIETRRGQGYVFRG
jgi:DNA-binding response OmpR family regulator